MRVSPDAPSYDAVADAVLGAGGAAERTAEIIAPAPIALPARQSSAPATRMVAFPTATIEDAVIAPMPAVADVPRRALAERRRAMAQKAVVGQAKAPTGSRSIATASRGLNGLAALLLGGGAAFHAGVMPPATEQASPRYSELASQSVAPVTVAMQTAPASPAGIAASLMALRHAHGTVRLVPTHAAWREERAALTSTTNVVSPAPELVRVASITLAAHADVAPMIEIAPVAAEPSSLENLAPQGHLPTGEPRAASADWKTTLVLVQTPARASASSATTAGVTTAAPGIRQGSLNNDGNKSPRNARRAQQSASRHAAAHIVPLSSNGIAQPVTVQRPARADAPAKHWSNSAFEAGR